MVPLLVMCVLTCEGSLYEALAFHQEAASLRDNSTDWLATIQLPLRCLMFHSLMTMVLQFHPLVEGLAHVTCSPTTGLPYIHMDWWLHFCLDSFQIVLGSVCVA